MEVTEISKEKFNGVYILGIDAKDIYLSNHYLNTPDKTGYRIRGTNGTISTRKFVNTLDYSLDLIKLREIYEKVYRRINFGWNVGDKEYTQYVINVTFKYSVKAYNRIRKGLYIKNGWSPHEIALTDCADVRNGELVAIQIDADVDEPICDDLLGNYFWFCDGQYHVKQNVKQRLALQPCARIFMKTASTAMGFIMCALKGHPDRAVLANVCLLTKSFTEGWINGHTVESKLKMDRKLTWPLGRHTLHLPQAALSTQ